MTAGAQIRVTGPSRAVLATATGALVAVTSAATAFVVLSGTGSVGTARPELAPLPPATAPPGTPPVVVLPPGALGLPGFEPAAAGQGDAETPRRSGTSPVLLAAPRGPVLLPQVPGSPAARLVAVPGRVLEQLVPPTGGLVTGPGRPGSPPPVSPSLFALARPLAVPAAEPEQEPGQQGGTRTPRDERPDDADVLRFSSRLAGPATPPEADELAESVTPATDGSGTGTRAVPARSAQPAAGAPGRVAASLSTRAGHHRSDRPGQGDRAATNGKAGKAGKVGKAGKAGKAGKSGKGDKGDRTERGERSGDRAGKKSTRASPRGGHRP